MKSKFGFAEEACDAVKTAQETMSNAFKKGVGFMVRGWEWWFP